MALNGLSSTAPNLLASRRVIGASTFRAIDNHLQPSVEFSDQWRVP